MSQWYALRTVTRRETTVAAELAGRGLTFFLPMETTLAGSPPVRHMAPALPGYVFVVCDDGDFANLHGIEDVLGFVRYVREDGAAWPMPLPGDQILELQVRERQGELDSTRAAKAPKYAPRKGERVQITAGTYLGFFAKVLAASGQDRRKLVIEGLEPPRHTTADVRHLSAA
jgi:transcription antitermination factor NusG